MDIHTPELEVRAVQKIFAVMVAAAFASGCSLIPGTEQHTTEKARELLSVGLFDADAAKFKDVRRIHTERPPEDVICGLVNAKNRIGAYVGFRRFLASETNGFVAVEQEGAGQEIKNYNAGFAAAWEPCESMGKQE